MNPTLTPTDFLALSPLLILLFGALIILLIESFNTGMAKLLSSSIAMISLIAALIAEYFAPNSESPLLTPWLRFDTLSQVFTVFFILIGIASTLLAAAFFRRFTASHGEYYFLLLSALIGLILIGRSADFLTLFLGLETFSVALYVLCGYMKKWKLSHESAIKYLLTGAIAAAILLYGIALVYGAVGTTRFDALMTNYEDISGASQQMLFLIGIALITVGLAFKAAIVPFHVWAPDVYDGAPTPVTAFMSVGTKVGAFAAFALIFLVALPHFDILWNIGISMLAYPTLIYANFVALRQTQLRRFFAYSGISHSGFLLIPLAIGTTEALPAMLFYLAIYVFATLGAFAVISNLDTRQQGVSISDLNGLFHRSPWLSLVLSLCLLTLAGIPPTAGFLAKFYLFKLAFEAGFYGLVIVGLFTTILSAYYYLKIISVMLSEKPSEVFTLGYLWQSALVAIFALVAIVVFSIYPEPLLAIFNLF